MTPQTPHISEMTPSQLATFESAVISACIAHDQARYNRGCVVIEQKYFVKFDNYGILRPEVETQAYIYQYAKSDASAPRVPEILRFFKSENMGYVVMEYINLSSPPDAEKAAEKAAEALN